MRIRRHYAPTGHYSPYGQAVFSVWHIDGTTVVKSMWFLDSTLKKISSEFCSNLNLLKSQRIAFTFIAQIYANFVWAPVCQNSKADIRRKHTTLLTKNARHPYSLGMAKLVWQRIATDSSHRIECIAIHCQTNLAILREYQQSWMVMDFVITFQNLQWILKKRWHWY